MIDNHSSINHKGTKTLGSQRDPLRNSAISQRSLRLNECISKPELIKKGRPCKAAFIKEMKNKLSQRFD